MQCRTLKWMPVCAALSLSSCQHMPIDSFCQVYQPIVQQKGDGAITAASSVKRRILANELTYRDQCGVPRK